MNGLIILVALVNLIASRDITTISFSERSNLSKIGMAEVFKNEGAFAIVDLPFEFSSSILFLQENSENCLRKEAYPEFLLPDGSFRRTLAVDGQHFEESDLPPCVSKQFLTVQKYFDELDSLVVALVKDLAGTRNTTWTSPEDQKDHSISEIYFKDHLHVYSKKSKPGEPLSSFAAPPHKDNGLILYLTPFAQHPLQLTDRYGFKIDTSSLGEDSVLIMFGRALSEWLLWGPSEQFHAPTHSVLTMPETVQSRTVMARMKMLPDNALSQRGEYFGDFFKNSLEKNNHAGRLCATSAAWSGLQKAECRAGEAYCWMDCLPLPDECSMSQSECVTAEAEPCCTEEITENCAAMTPSCHWECRAETTSVASTDSTTSRASKEESFCVGGTDMYMRGFAFASSKGNACVILLFQSWMLNTKEKFIIACVGVIIFGVSIEGLLCLRRNIQSRKILLRMSSPMRRLLTIFLFGVNVASGYFAMLVAMTYSGELFMCMVLGLLLGHGIFNTRAEVAESVDPCCASQTIVAEAEGEKQMATDF